MNTKTFYIIILTLSILALGVSVAALISAAKVYANLPRPDVSDDPAIVDMPGTSDIAGISDTSSTPPSVSDNEEADNIQGTENTPAPPIADVPEISAGDTGDVGDTIDPDTGTAAVPPDTDVSAHPSENEKYYTLKLDGNTLYILDPEGKTVFSRDIPSDKLRDEDRRRLTEGINFSDRDSATDAVWDLLT